jgi:lipoprotein-releasing system ATP-binding protein
MTTVLHCKSVSKSFQQGESRISVLEDINLSLQAGESMAIMGASGSGKSTLLNLLGGLDQPDSGEIEINGHGIASLADKQLSELRNGSIGFVYQLHHLLMEFTALENTMMPLLIGGVDRKQAASSATELLTRVGLDHRLSHKPSELSGGERQRVAIARALVNRPACVLMDEPTGNLDADTAASILDLIQEFQHELDTSFVVVSHDPELARRIGPVFRLERGGLVGVDAN